MPGGKGNRTKGNVKPSSSSRAAELLTQSGGGATGFVGFGGLAGTGAYVPASQVFDDEDTSLDSDFRVVMRKLTKRDATTKIKALGEFSTLCKEKDDNTLQAVLPFWPRLFNKLAIDTDPKVRECTQNAMAVLVSRVRRNLAPYLKSVMGAWILSRNDTYPTVASAANKSFSAAFPPDKQENAIVFCKQAVLEYMTDNLLNQTASTLSDPKTTEKEEMEAKLMRVQCSSLMGLRQLLLALPSAQIDDALKGHLRGLLNEGKFWNLAKLPQLLVCSGVFWFVGGVCQVVPDVAGEYVRKLSPLVLGSVDSSEPGLTSAVWDAVLSLVKFVPTCWENINWQKAFWPKLKNLLESGCQGNAASLAPYLLPLLSCVPLETAGGATVFFPKVLEHFKLGFAQDSVANSPSESNAWARAIMECLQFSFKRILSESSSPQILQTIMLDQLIPVVEASLFDPKPSLSRSNLFPAVSAFLKSLESDTNTSSVAQAFWAQLSDDIVGMFETVGSGGKQSLRPDRLGLFVKALLNPQTVSAQTGVKTERVKFAGEEKQTEPRVPFVAKETEVSEAMKGFVKKMVVHSHKLYQKDHSCVHLKLFVDLANLYFPADIAAFVLQSLERNEAGEETPVSGEIMQNAHGRVIDRVVLPVLRGKEEGESGREIVDHTITLLFACLPYLSEEKSTDVWDNVLQNVSSTKALCSLIERALEKRKIMPQVSKWLSSPRLHSRLCDLVTMVTTQHASSLPLQLEEGWRVICLVLSANDDNEPVFPSSWIVDIVSSIHRELVTLGTRTLAPQEAHLAIQFVARAALTFFQNLRMSLCMSEGRDVIVALMMADLDTSFPTTGSAGSLVRESWSTGLGLAVRETGGLIQDGGMLTSACHVIRGTLLTKTSSLEQYRRVVDVTEALLKTTQSHLPQDDSDDNDADNDDDENSHSCNPVLVALLSELIVPQQASLTYSRKIVQYLCVSDQLPLTSLDYLSDQGQGEGDCSESLVTPIFSSLFNLQLLSFCRSGFSFENEDGRTKKSREVEWSEAGNIVLESTKSVVLTSAWLKVQKQISPDIVSAVEELEKTAHNYFLSSPESLQQQVMERAFDSMTGDLMGVLVIGQLAQLLSTLGASKATSFQQIYSERVDGLESGSEVIVPYLPLWKVLEIFRLQAGILTSITADTLSAATSCLRVMGECVCKDAGAIATDCDDLLKVSLENLKNMRDEHADLFLFSCNIVDEALWKVAFNVSAMQFLMTVVNSDACSLAPDVWDFILCSAVSWIESLDNSSISFASPAHVQTFCVAACRLLATVADAIQRRLPLNRDAFPPNLETEWKEFFAEGIYSFLFPLFVRLLGGLKEHRAGEAEVVVRAVGSAMSQCPQDRVVNHNLPLRLTASDDTSPLPDTVQSLLNHLCPVLTCPVAPAQVSAFAVLDKMAPLLPTYGKEQEPTEGASGGASETEPRTPPAMLMKVIEDCATAMDIVLSPVDMGTMVAMAPGSEEYQFALGYLLAWQLMLHLFHSAGSKGRAEYASYLKDHSHVERLLTHLFRLMPPSPGFGGSASSPVKSPTSGSPLKPLSSTEASGCDSWFESSVLPLSAEGVGEAEDIQRAVCCVYLHCLEVIPVLVRQWWKDQDRKSAAYVDKFTTKYVSPQLIRSEMHSVNNSESAIPDLLVKANSITRQVTASYTMEELKAEIQITLPESYPLGEISVDAQRHAVVKQAQWERMLLQLTIFLQHQNGTIMEGLRLWKRNIDKRIEGVEECFICYAVIHASNYELPMVPCKTCKKKFHKACLYKWLSSSQNATCPLCRSIF